MAKILKRETYNGFQDLCLIETEVSNKEAGHQYGSFARLTLLKLDKGVEFKRISQKESEVISTQIFRRTVSKFEDFKKTERYKKSNEAQTYKNFEALFQDFLEESKVA